MKTSIRLALTSFAVSCITLAAAGTPLPFLGSAPAAASPASVAATPAALDGDLAGLPGQGAHTSFRIE